ncbi:hypothetical protein F5B21DRAFT_201744 [Xylaria acuta]|nr:hypothetical protein F5B21DRAFT_201744 [Xylaria acuta]
MEVIRPPCSDCLTGIGWVDCLSGFSAPFELYKTVRGRFIGHGRESIWLGCLNNFNPQTRYTHWSVICSFPSRLLFLWCGGLLFSCLWLVSLPGYVYCVFRKWVWLCDFIGLFTIWSRVAWRLHREWDIGRRRG